MSINVNNDIFIFVFLEVVEPDWYKTTENSVIFVFVVMSQEWYKQTENSVIFLIVVIFRNDIN